MWNVGEDKKEMSREEILEMVKKGLLRPIFTFCRKCRDEGIFENPEL
jgi:hypothetical protein